MQSTYQQLYWSESERSAPLKWERASEKPKLIHKKQRIHFNARLLNFLSFPLARLLCLFQCRRSSVCALFPLWILQRLLLSALGARTNVFFYIAKVNINADQRYSLHISEFTLSAISPECSNAVFFLRLFYLKILHQSFWICLFIKFLSSYPMGLPSWEPIKIGEEKINSWIFFTIQNLQMSISFLAQTPPTFSRKSFPAKQNKKKTLQKTKKKRKFNYT